MRDQNKLDEWDELMDQVQEMAQSGDVDSDDYQGKTRRLETLQRELGMGDFDIDED